MTKGDLINAVAEAAKTSKRAAEEAATRPLQILAKRLKGPNEFRCQALALSR
jgi:nucleoid DNA-binding protein